MLQTSVGSASLKTFCLNIKKEIIVTWCWVTGGGDDANG